MISTENLFTPLPLYHFIKCFNSRNKFVNLVEHHTITKTSKNTFMWITDIMNDKLGVSVDEPPKRATQLGPPRCTEEPHLIFLFFFPHR